MSIGNFPKNLLTKLVIVLATVAFLGLTVLQVINLESSIDTNKKIFLQKVDLASASIASSFTLNETYSRKLFDAEKRVQKSEELNDPEMDRIFRALIDPALSYHGIETSYEYAVYSHKASTDGFRFVMGDDGASLDFSLASCENPNERGHGWANLTCSMEPLDSDYHLALFFPNQDAYVFAESQGALSLAIVFIVLLIVCFTYTLIVINDQKKLSEIKNDFINNLTHEFKTPISSINLSANLLKNKNSDLDDDRRFKYIDLIEQESKRLEGQVDKILQIAMLDSGNFTIEKTEVDIHNVIKRVLKSMSLTIDQRKARVTLSFDAINPVIMGDGTHMINIIYNLIDNALKYTVDTPHITISTSNEDEGVKISIKDNGIGIGEEIQNYIFDRFYRVQSGNVHTAKGFGLGLSYVKKLVDAHKGKIALNSKPDHGSEFLVYLPAL